MAPVDVDGDSLNEILVADSAQNLRLFKIRQDGVEQLSERKLEHVDHLYALDVGDVDRDGEKEVLWRASRGFHFDFDSVGLVGATPDLKLEWTNKETFDVKGPFIGGDLAKRYSAPPVAVFAWGSLVAMSLESGELSRSGRSPVWWPSALRVLDYDNDGSDEAVVVEEIDLGGYVSAFGTSVGMYVTQ